MEVWCHLVWLLYFTHDSSPQDMWPVGFYNICSLKGTRIFDLNKIRWRLIDSVFWMSHIHITVSQTFTHLKRKWDWVLGLFKKHFNFQGSRKYIHIYWDKQHYSTLLDCFCLLFLFAAAKYDICVSLLVSPVKMLHQIYMAKCKFVFIFVSSLLKCVQFWHPKQYRQSGD